MTEHLGKHIPFGESGYYSDHTLGCFNVIDEVKASLLSYSHELVTAAKTRGDREFRIADFGAADGFAIGVVTHLAAVEPRYH